MQPVLFTFLFVYIFGGAIPIPGGGTYVDYLLAGMLALNLVTSTMGTAVGLSTDLHEGIIDRFRTLPMWRSAVLVGRSLADFMTSCLCALIVALTGLVVGWRPGANPVSIVGGFLLVLFFAYAVTWVTACVGLNSKSPESAASFGFIVLFPMTFVSNALVPTQHMPGWMQAIADWNPVSAVVAGARVLWGNPNPSGTDSGLADAASGLGVVDLVGGDRCGGGSAGGRTSSSGGAPSRRSSGGRRPVAVLCRSRLRYRLRYRPVVGPACSAAVLDGGVTCGAVRCGAVRCGAARLLNHAINRCSKSEMGENGLD